MKIETIKNAVKYFLGDLGIHHHRVVIQSGDDIVEFDNYTQYGTPQTQIVVSVGVQKTGNYGECFPLDGEYLVTVDASLPTTKQLIVLAHELKHVADYVKHGRTSEQSAHANDISGLWYALQIGLITKERYMNAKRLAYQAFGV